MKVGQFLVADATSSIKLITQHPCSHEWPFQMQLVQAAHEIQVSVRNRLGTVIEAAATDADQLGLLCHR